MTDSDRSFSYPPFITDPGEVYRHALNLLVRRYLPNSD